MKNEKVTAEKKGLILGNLILQKTIEDLSRTKLVIEEIIEDLAIKRTVLCELESLLAADMILVTNTSSFDLNKMDSVLKLPQNFVIILFFNPAPIMILVEIRNSQYTASAIADTAFRLSEQWSKSLVHGRSSP